MATKKKKSEMSFEERMLLLHKAGLTHNNASDQTKDYHEIDDLSLRIKKILEISERNHLDSSKMLYFVMYDIENNKVRTLISKYLLKKGCQRVQKSIFFAESERSVYNEIKNDLVEVQESYWIGWSMLCHPYREVVTLKMVRKAQFSEQNQFLSK